MLWLARRCSPCRADSQTHGLPGMVRFHENVPVAVPMELGEDADISLTVTAPTVPG